MQLEAFISEVENKGISCVVNEPMARHTTFRLGGKADAFVTVSSSEELAFVLRSALKNEVPVFLIGKGSNLLVSDDGIAGAVISISGMNEIKVEGNRIICGAGASLTSLCAAARDASLSGLEFAFGIPGSVGGALFMNAGAYGGEMSQVVVSAECMDENGEMRHFSADEMQLGYRTSVFKKGGLFITSVTVELKTGERAEIASKMEELISRRKDKQPLEYPSAGSTFKRPEGYFAGALIEKNGLKGMSCNGARVSEKHAGFVINSGEASCADVLELIQKIQSIVLQNDGVMLETEVLFVGRDRKEKKCNC